MTCYYNTNQELSITFTGTLDSTYTLYLGTSPAFKGFVWYFVLTDDSTYQSSLISLGASSTCLTPSCTTSSYSPATIDPYLGTGFLSPEISETTNSAGTSCPQSSTASCYGSVLLVCGCSTSTCIFNTTLNSNVCWCPTGETGGASSCSCSTGYYLVGSNCCENSCASCSSGTSLCLTCIASNAVPDASVGCNCNSGYYGTKPLSTTTACIACYTECATCSAANLCLTCKATYGSPSTTQGCNCKSGYYGTKPLVTAGACVACYSACATCSQANICLTCIASNAYPDATQGCDCNSGYYGTKPLTTTNSCTACYSACATCSQANICLTCIASNARVKFRTS